MKKILLSAIMAVFSFCISKAESEYVGYVSDEYSQPVPYASIYVKNNPFIGTITDDDGNFTLAIDDEYKSGVLVCSFIGYETVEVKISDMIADSLYNITLVEQPIMLDAAEVMAKISKKQSRKIKQNVLAAFVKRLEDDFPRRNTSYPVVSSYQGSQEKRELIRHEIIGTVSEYQDKEDDSKIKIRVDVDSEKEFVTEEVEESYEVFNQIAAEQKAKQGKKKKKKNRVSVKYTKRDLDEQMTKMHKFLWGGYTSDILDIIDVDKLAKWDYTTIGSQNILTYTEKENYIGIVKIKVQVHFYIDPSTFSISKIAQGMDVEAHIPFGYKLKEKELEFINLLQPENDTLDSFRVKHIYLDLKRNIFFSPMGDQKVVKEKNVESQMSVLDRKKNSLNYSAKSKIVVNGKPIINQ